MQTAVASVAEHVLAHNELHATVALDHNVAEWEAAVFAWEMDPSMPNPFELTVDHPTQAAVRKELADEEKAAAEKPDHQPAPTDEISPAGLIAWGIDLENEQYVFALSLSHPLGLTPFHRRTVKSLSNRLWEHAKDRQISRTTFRTNALVRKVETWYRLLQLYMPGTAILRSKDMGKARSAFDLPLYLPSSSATRITVDPRLSEIEYRLRVAQAHEALGTIRRNLQIRATLYDAKDRWARGQGANTRALNAIATVQARINASADEYRQARLAVMALTPITNSPCTTHTFLPLATEDIRAMTEMEPVVMMTEAQLAAEKARASQSKKKGKSKSVNGKGGQGSTGVRGETKRTLSWIWRAVDSSKDLQTDFAADSECRFSSQIDVCSDMHCSIQRCGLNGESPALALIAIKRRSDLSRKK